MKRYDAGETTKAGFYFNMDQWEMTVLTGDGGRLPGDEGNRFVRVPMPAMLALAPVMGGLLVMFLPAIGFGLVLYYGGHAIACEVRDGAQHVAGTLQHAWVPGVAYLTGRHRASKKAEDAPAAAPEPVAEKPAAPVAPEAPAESVEA